ncbi:MAG: DUF2088 domain-containing protein [Planctomycetaceae bacterium]|jgi:hypothetical protein|nr:DUF2088 domain-containing protein [Planctomycetaceae bacterium]MBP63096.1 DUF2088 domain-containing protein [Planctomycetaceae bacterium]
MNMKITRLRRVFPDRRLPDPRQTLVDRLQRWWNQRKGLPGRRIAIAAGSRGIDRLPEVTATLVSFLREQGASPFIVPAMGSHAGANAASQERLLAALGIDEQVVGAPVCSSMDTVQLGEVEVSGRTWPLMMDRLAAEADGIVLVNRIKPHTDFSGTIESGLLKMLVVGLGKERGAQVFHSQGTVGLRQALVPMARALLGTGKVLAGVALLEDAQHQLAQVDVLSPEEMVQRESEFLKLAKSWAADLPIEQLDGLVISRMGKEISGTGIDTNVVGRVVIANEPDFPRPKISLIGVSDLTDGNATGVGIADFTTQRLAGKINAAVTARNIITSTFLERGKLPLVWRDDREMIQEMVQLLARRGIGQPRLIFIRDTLSLEIFYATEPVVREVVERQDVSVVAEPIPLEFDGDGRLLLGW